MKKLCRLGCIVALVASMGLTSCHNYTPRKQEAKSNVVRIYDVEPQDRSNMNLITYERYMQMKMKSDDENPNVDEREKYKEEVAAMDAVLFSQHEYRMGVFTGAGPIAYKFADQPNFVEADVPFEKEIKAISEETGIDIDYMMLGSWEEVRRDMEEYEDDSITKIILFNNSYDGSLIREASTGKYEDLSYILKELGMYDEELYDQTVLRAGVVDEGQYLVPILYNVSGMLHGEWKYTEEMEEEFEKGIFDYTTIDEYQPESISYKAFIEKLNEEMMNWDTSSNVPLFLSPGFYENEPDLFLLASGIEWGGYKEQYPEFALLLEYMKTYQEMQVEERYGMSLQESYINFLKNVEHADPRRSNIQAKVNEEIIKEVGDGQLSGFSIAETIVRETKYFIESTQAEETAFHSIIGLLSYYGRYIQAMTLKEGNLEVEFGKATYWPIGILEEESVYAAQPLCYAAVVDGGNTELAGKVIQKLAEYPWAAEYGLSPCIETRTHQIDQWGNTDGLTNSIRDIVKQEDGSYAENNEGAFWSFGAQAGKEMARETFAEQLRNQVANVVTAEIPDRELLAIWRNTLTEAVEDELSAEEGFEILCQRMDEWYGK